MSKERCPVCGKQFMEGEEVLYLSSFGGGGELMMCGMECAKKFVKAALDCAKQRPQAKETTV